MLDTRKVPTIKTRVPSHNETDVASDLSEIVLTFNTDLKRNVYGEDEQVITLGDLIKLRDSDGIIVPTEVVYHLRVVTVQIKGDLRLGEKYTLTVNERGIGKPGVTSVEGIEMETYESLYFFTRKEYLIKPPQLVSPVDRSELKAPFQFEWINVNIPDSYEVQISKYADMSILLNDTPNRFVDELNEETSRSSFYNGDPQQFQAGQYFWRVASWFKHGTIDKQRSPWSETRTFYVEDVRYEGTVTPEDAPGTDPFYQFDQTGEFDSYAELIETFPKNEGTNVNTNVRVIYFKVTGEPSPEDIEENFNFEIIGESVLGDEEDDFNVEWYAGEIENKGSYSIIPFYLGPKPAVDPESTP